MTIFPECAPFERLCFLLGLFLTLCLSAMLLVLSFDPRRRRHTLVLDFSLIAALFLLLTAGTMDHRQEAEGVVWLPLPIWTLWNLIILVLLYYLTTCAVYLHLDRQKLTRSSIKRAFDNLPAAVCYFTSDGLVQMCNLQMHRLYRVIGGRDLQTLDELRTALAGSRTAGSSVYLLPDGSAWHYTESPVTVGKNSYLEVLFTDVTQLHAKRLELEAQNEQLREISRSLKTLSDNVLTMTRERELLNYKILLHDQMGAGLLAVRQCLRQGKKTEDFDAAIRLWKKAVRLIQDDNEHPDASNSYSEFLQDAKALGLRIILKGGLPHGREALEIFLVAMRECATNCVRYAESTELYAEISRTDGGMDVRITNNGKPPRAEIVPGGGLANLQRYVARAGGRMQIQSLPFFELTLQLPDQEERAE